MSDTATTDTAAVETSDDSAVTTAEVVEVEAPAEGEQALGDAGKQALDRMKAERNAARKEAQATAAMLAEMQAKIDGKEAEFKAEQERRSRDAETLSKTNQRIVKSEFKAAAKGVLADPADAYKFIDLDSFEVDDDGNVDEDAIASALTDLVKSKPYLAAQGNRFQGGADGGTRKESRPAQLSRANLAEMSPEAIETARKEGRLNDLLGIKP